MCGFLGQYNAEYLPPEEFTAILNLSRHRGPDDQRIVTSGKVQFGFNRLSILDLSDAGAQPMESFSGRYLIMMNGEIYNHLELRNRLSATAYRGHSDTETLCRALDEWGLCDTLENLDGMFALAIYDRKEEILSLARDHAGIKPLFYGRKSGSVIFSSQYDQLLKHPVLQDVSINPQVLKLYLQQQFMPAPFGLYKHTHQLKPGQCIQFDQDGEYNAFYFWEFPELSDDLLSEENKALDLIEEMLDKSVQAQMLADVPLGAFLSGGVDSPLVCSSALKHDRNLKAFCIGSDSRKHNEAHLAQQYAQTLKLELEVWNLNASEVLNHWQEAISSLHEPLADFSIIPTYLVSKLARKELTVALSGDGGDELFFGYERFWSMGKNLPFQHYPSVIRKGIYASDKLLTGNKTFNDILLSDKQSAAHELLHSRFRPRYLDLVFPDLVQTSLPDEWLVYSYSNTSDELELLHEMRKAEYYGMMQKTLRKVDLASMQNSLEVRVPFLQKSFIETAARIHPSLSYGKGKKKQILKTLLNQRIPAYKDDNIKRGFTVPLGPWIREDLRSEFEGNILEGNLEHLGMQKNHVEQLFKDHLAGEDRKWPLFTLLALNQHLEQVSTQ